MSSKQSTRTVKLVRVVSNFLDGKASSTGTGKYKVRSTGDELYSGGTCIAMWQGSRVLVYKGRESRTANQCTDVLRFMALHRGISYVNTG